MRSRWPCFGCGGRSSLDDDDVLDVVVVVVVALDPVFNVFTTAWRIPSAKKSIGWVGWGNFKFNYSPCLFHRSTNKSFCVHPTPIPTYRIPSRLPLSKPPAVLPPSPSSSRTSIHESVGGRGCRGNVPLEGGSEGTIRRLLRPRAASKILESCGDGKAAAVAVAAVI